MAMTWLLGWEYIIRILLAAMCGALIGFEREKRFKSAGLRTHILVAMASALMMIVSKYGFFDVLGTKGVSLDASRIAAGVVTAIGFLGAGVIFVRNESTIGITTAAGLWATVGIGIAIGAGMYFIGVMTTLLVIVIQYLLHSKHLRVGTQLAGIVVMDLDDPAKAMDRLNSVARAHGMSIRHMEAMYNAQGRFVLKVDLVFKKQVSLPEAIKRLQEIGTIETMETFSPS